MANCTVNQDLAPWVMASTVETIIICVFGALGNSASLWCLIQCKRMNTAIKIQLGSFFTLLFTVCVVTLPGKVFVYYVSVFCRKDLLNQTFKTSISTANSIVAQMERVNFTFAAVYRLVAVRWPHRYKQIATVRVVVASEVIAFLCVLLPWIIMWFLQIFPSGRSWMNLNFSNKKSSLSQLAAGFAATSYILPLVVCLLAYLVMMFTLTFQKKKELKASRSKTEQLSYAIRVLILVNILLDAPHVIIHLVTLPRGHLSIVIIHMIFNLHLLVDSLIFIGLNPSYRRALMQLFKRCLPQVVAAHLSTVEDSTVTRPETSLTTMNTKYHSVAAV